MVTAIINPKLWRPGLRGVFGLEFEQWTPEYKEIFKDAESTYRFEEYQEIAPLGLVPEQSAGANVQYDDFIGGSTNQVVNIAYGLGYIIQRELIDDNQYELAKKFPKALAGSVILTTETAGANLLNNGFSTSYLFGNGKPLFSTSHPTPGDGGTFQNTPTTQADLAEASLEQAFIDIGAYKDPRGNLIKVMPKKLVVHRNDEYTATKLTGSAFVPESMNNAVNPVMYNNKLPDGYAVNHYLTDNNAWFVITDQDGLIFQKRVWPAEFREDNDFESLNIKQATYFRFRFWCYDPRAIYGCSGST